MANPSKFYYRPDEVDEGSKTYRDNCKVLYEAGEWFRTANMVVEIQPNVDPLAVIVALYLKNRK